MMYLASMSGVTGVPSAVRRVIASLEIMIVWLRRGAVEVRTSVPPTPQTLRRIRHAQQPRQPESRKTNKRPPSTGSPEQCQQESHEDALSIGQGPACTSSLHQDVVTNATAEQTRPACSTAARLVSGFTRPEIASAAETSLVYGTYRVCDFFPFVATSCTIHPPPVWLTERTSENFSAVAAARRRVTHNSNTTRVEGYEERGKASPDHIPVSPTRGGQ